MIVWNELLPKINQNRPVQVLKESNGDLPWPGAARSLAVAPLFSRANLLGLLILASKQSNAFLEEHLSLLQAIAGQIAMAVDNTHLAGLLQNRKI